MRITKKLVTKIESLMKGGLSAGLGNPNEMMCVEAAVCAALGLPHSDNPPCVGEAVRSFKIALNDSEWSNPLARADGMRKIAIAQLGSDSLDQIEFTRRISEKTIRILIPALFREVFKDNEACLKAADRCETGVGAANASAAYAAYAASRAAAAASRAAYDYAYAAARAAAAASRAAAGTAAAGAAAASRAAARAARETTTINDYTSYAAYAASDKYLLLSAELCFQALNEMNSPGAVWMEKNKWFIK